MDLPPIYHHTGLETSGGATRVARLLISGLKKQKVETNLSFELAEKADGAAILPEDFGRYLPDVALGHVHCTGNWSALLGSIAPGRKTIITMHDCDLFTGGCPYPLDCSNLDEGCAEPCPRKFPDSTGIRKAKFRQVRRLESTLVAPSRWLARLARTHLHRAVVVIPNGIPWPNRPLPKAAARQQLGINPAAKVVVFAAHGGMTAAYKSGDAWRGIWQQLKDRHPELLCFAVGGDKEERQGDLVIWPYVERRKLSLLMTAADVLLYPTKADNHSLVILEAMSQNLPVVSYAVGGVPEQITDGVTGMLVPPGDPAAFLDAATTLLANPVMIRQMGMEAFSAGQKRFSYQRMVSGYMQLYARTLDSQNQ
ncbi:glycosyl transferase [Pseudodesulfovibrio nedwellii]|uniref:Glycosyl transferase n=1 Tax=Pseudodesulfovibrio nedwellii TaxID=2973072 RepID=A0ABM8B1W7_9BACT|nr:glycosyltransferase [Pseudodesulfovibrio nedwellii]BDQ37804.1 glycosyl transferase [Pseudodesulfovibrio nedwellii]